MYAKVNGTQIFFDVIGSEVVKQAPYYYRKPICFVFHGGPGSSHFHYLPSFLELADTFQLIMINARNTGFSPRGDYHENSLAQDADDGEALREYLGLDKIYVLGHSYGGMIAQKYAIEHSDHLHGLILSSSAPDYRFESYGDPVVERRGTEEQKELWKLKKQGKITNLADYISRMGSLYHYYYDTPEQAKEAEDGMIVSGKVQNTKVNIWQRNESGDLSSFDLKPDLHKIKCPVLLMCGAEDFITAPINSEHIKECIPQAEFHCIEKACHSIYDDNPELSFGYIRKFVNRITPRELK